MFVCIRMIPRLRKLPQASRGSSFLGEIMKALIARGTRVLLTIATGGLLLIAPTGTWAQQRLKYSFKDPVGVTKYTEQHTIDVGDVTGHQIRVASLQTKYATEAPEYDGVKVVEVMASLASDYVGLSGR